MVYKDALSHRGRALGYYSTTGATPDALHRLDVTTTTHSPAPAAEQIARHTPVL